eukprot:1244197-Alexandrium_andersonii.AAC.1
MGREVGIGAGKRMRLPDGRISRLPEMEAGSPRHCDASKDGLQGLTIAARATYALHARTI